ncbi:MAG: (d)CMP kinase [Angelakisella sp.]|nr:(d)CMP kinase [Angelakisella sp.]
MFSIALDGPSGAGKSTLAKAMGAKLNFLHVDTGAMYRAIGVAALRAGVCTTDSEAVTALLPSIHIELRFGPQGQRIFLGEEDVSEAIRMPEASMAASNVSAIPAVRAFLLEQQRDLARSNNVIMDGRDIGTVVLPNATLKVFLTASPQARAARRHKELVEKGHKVSYEQILEEVKLRDYNDSTRAAAPLKQAEDAVLADTTQLNFEESLALLLKIAANHGIHPVG